MRIYNDDEDRTISEVTLYLTQRELLELRGAANQLLNNQNLDHWHIDDESYTHEITVVRYGDGTEKTFNPRAIETIDFDR